MPLRLQRIADRAGERTALADHRDRRMLRPSSRFMRAGL